MDSDLQTTISLLEQQRQDNSRAMWLAPVLTMTAQAFLLQTLSRGGICAAARGAVLAAGLLATIAALWTLLRSRSREVLFSEAIAAELDRAGIPDVRPKALMEAGCLPETDGKSGVAKLDAQIAVWAGDELWLRAYVLWGVTLLAFMVADVAIFFAA